MTTRSPDRKRRNGLAAFRALEAEVRKALEAGWTLVAIYEAHRDRLATSYAQFARYAQPLRQGAQRAEAARSSAAVAAAPVPDSSRPPAVGTGPPKGRPEDAVPRLDMDGFATKALRNKDLF